MKISDNIEGFIIDLLSNHGSIELKRNELANYFNCVPSQINYVIQTRFTTERGYIVESRRGGGGYIKITKVSTGADNYFMHVINSIGDSIDLSTIEAILNNLIAYNMMDKTVAKLILAATNNNTLSVITDGCARNKLRASILKNIFINLY